MADTKISDLAAVVTLGLTDSFPVVQSGSTKKAVVSDIMDPTYSGNLKFADGYGLDFSASAGASASSSILDDYEEGTWTPNVASDATGVIAASPVGYYTKIGQQVFFTCLFNVTTNFTSSAIAGLPFTSKALNGAVSSYQCGVGFSKTKILIAAVSDPSQQFLLYEDGVDNPHIPTTAESQFLYRVSGQYISA